MRVGVVGINHKLADLQLRETLAKACQKQFQPSNPFHGDHAFCLLSTCNRTEVYFSSEDLADTHSYLLHTLRNEVEAPFEHKLYSYFGYDCLAHAMRVTAGIDSAIVGETEIQGQMKGAYEAASANPLPSAMHFMFQKSLKIGKQVRTKLQLGRGMPDIEHSVLTTGLQVFGDIWRRKILFVGASEINTKICCFFKQKGFENITLTNRSEDKAAAFASRHGIKTALWSAVEQWNQYDWIIVGTKAPDYVIGEHPSTPLENSRLIIDLSVPRNVDPLVAQNNAVTLYNIDELNRSVTHRERQMRDSVLLAEMLVVTEARRQMQLFEKKQRNKVLRLVGA